MVKSMKIPNGRTIALGIIAIAAILAALYQAVALMDASESTGVVNPQTYESLVAEGKIVLPPEPLVTTTTAGSEYRNEFLNITFSVPEIWNVEDRLLIDPAPEKKDTFTLYIKDIESGEAVFIGSAFSSPRVSQGRDAFWGDLIGWPEEYTSAQELCQKSSRPNCMVRTNPNGVEYVVVRNYIDWEWEIPYSLYIIPLKADDASWKAVSFASRGITEKEQVLQAMIDSLELTD